MDARARAARSPNKSTASSRSCADTPHRRPAWAWEGLEPTRAAPRDGRVGPHEGPTHARDRPHATPTPAGAPQCNPGSGTGAGTGSTHINSVNTCAFSFSAGPTVSGGWMPRERPRRQGPRPSHLPSLLCEFIQRRSPHRAAFLPTEQTLCALDANEP